MLKNIIKYLTGFLGLVVFIYLFAYFAGEATKVRTWQMSGTANSSVNSAEDSLLVFQRVEPNEFLSKPFPALGDTLKTIRDSTATIARWRDVLGSPKPPWREIPMEFSRDGQTHRTSLWTRVPSYEEFVLVSVLQMLRFLVTVFFVMVGLWAFFKRPDSAGVRALALFSFAMAGFMITSVVAIGTQFAAFRIPLDTIIRTALDILSSFFSAFWLNLVFLFPRPIGFLRKRPVPAYLICYLPTALFTAIYLIAQAAQKQLDLGTVWLVLISLQVFAGAIILAVRRARSEDRLERRQTKLVLWGTGAGLGLLFLLICMALIFQSWFIENPTRALLIINIAFLGLLLSPVSFAYAFGRYRLLEVEGKLRRGTRYALATGSLLALVIAVGFLLSVFLRSQLGESGTNVAMFVTVVAALGVLPLARQAQSFLEHKFYPERQRLRQMILDFLEQVVALPDRQSFWIQLEEKLRNGLMVDGVYPVVFPTTERDRLLLRDSDWTPFEAGSSLVKMLERDRRPMMVDEAVSAGAIRPTLEEAAWIKVNRIAVMVPLLTHGRLVGFLALGMKTEREDYAAEELRILNSLASQVAIASENIRLVEENVEKQRLEEQLQIARKIQRGFLPGDLPPTPGLALAARSRFCLEVAGDYYDVIPLENRETVLAVADVSGKGAGAALLMANLQASLRTAVGVGIRLADIVARINNLIFQNTPIEEYITFFVGIFSPDSRSLTFVNAGHNPALLLRQNGFVESLCEGGLILGMAPNLAYSQTTVELAPGELLLMYTDGVSEAMNCAGEEFGEERLKALLVEYYALSPQELLERMESELVAFHGSEVFEDDFTLLIARVEGK
ncbi:MAG: PP2C family protein-serine/threonine phosphatase [bacterium]